MSDKVITEQPQKRGAMGRVVDSFKRPIEKDEATVYVQAVDPEKMGSASSTTGVVDGDQTADDSGLKRNLHGRHLQVSCPFMSQEG
jgi:hypothetical protein